MVAGAAIEPGSGAYTGNFLHACVQRGSAHLHITTNVHPCTSTRTSHVHVHILGAAPECGQAAGSARAT